MEEITYNYCALVLMIPTPTKICRVIRNMHDYTILYNMAVEFDRLPEFWNP